MENEEYEIMFLETVMKLWCKNYFFTKKKARIFLRKHLPYQSQQ